MNVRLMLVGSVLLVGGAILLNRLCDPTSLPGAASDIRPPVAKRTGSLPDETKASAL